MQNCIRFAQFAQSIICKSDFHVTLRYLPVLHKNQCELSRYLVSAFLNDDDMLYIVLSCLTTQRSFFNLV